MTTGNIVGDATLTWNDGSYEWDMHMPSDIEYYSEKIKEPMKKKVFQYMVVLHEFETKEGKEEYKDSKVIIDLKTVMAKSEKELVFKITREIPEQYATNPDNVEIIIRNF